MIFALIGKLSCIILPIKRHNRKWLTIMFYNSYLCFCKIIMLQKQEDYLRAALHGLRMKIHLFRILQVPIVSIKSENRRKGKLTYALHHIYIIENMYFCK